MKRCSRCGQDKPVEEFAVRKNRRSRQPWCRSCKNAYDRDWYRRNKEKHIQAVNELKRGRNEQKRELVREAKRVPCADCGVRYPPYVMDFDHGEQEKLGDISQKTELWSVERLEAEIAKCDVVCANCHRERTYGAEGQHPSRRGDSLAWRSGQDDTAGEQLPLSDALLGVGWSTRRTSVWARRHRRNEGWREAR